jgi:hypothetical protein
MKSVLHVALIAPNGYTNLPFMDAFLNNGFDTYHCFDYQLETFEYGREVMRQRLLQMAKATRPDLIFMHVQNSETLDVDTVKELSSFGFTVFYTFDARTKEQTEWLYNMAPHVGLICFSSKDDVEEAKVRWHTNTMVLQSSCDMDFYKPHLRHPSGIIFIGGNYQHTNLNFPLADERVEMVERMKKRFGDDFNAYGIGWPGSKLIGPKEELELYYKSAIAISHNNFDRELYTSDRLWRIMASGTFCLTKYFLGIENLFQRGIHLDWWHDFDELEMLADHYLKNDDLRESIAWSGSLHVRSEHRWTHRIKEMMNMIEYIRPKNTPCLDAHRIDGIIPVDQMEFDGRTCDCGKLIFHVEDCGCGGNKTKQLRAEQA